MSLRKLKKGSSYFDAEKMLMFENEEEIEVSDDLAKAIGDVFVSEDEPPPEEGGVQRREEENQNRDVEAVVVHR